MLSGTRIFVYRVLAVLVIFGIGFLPNGLARASADPVPVTNFPFSSPLFGLAAAPDGSLLVADSGQGIVNVRKGQGKLVAKLPGVTDVAPLGRGVMYAITGAAPEQGPSTDPNARKLFKVSNGNIKMIADLGKFEEINDPDGQVDSNPYDVQLLSDGQVLVADAGGNDLLRVDKKGNIDWVAVLPDEVVSTDNLKSLLGCPNPDPSLPPDVAGLCFLPPAMPAQAVATSIAVGPDGAYYVGELKGFPGPAGMSRIWRIDPSAKHAHCGSDPECTVVADGFTSIVDLAFGPNGMLYVTELDEASFLAIELAGMTGNPAVMKGGTVNACDTATWQCHEVASGLTMPIATTVDKFGNVYSAINALLPSATVVKLP